VTRPSVIQPADLTFTVPQTALSRLLQPATNAITFYTEHVILCYTVDLHEKTIGSCHSTKWDIGLQLENNCQLSDNF